MKKMKRIGAIGLAGAMIVSMAACGSKNESKGGGQISLL